MDLPAHRRTPRGPRESKEVVAHTMLPYELKVTAACQTHRTPEARYDLAPLHRWLAGWPPLGNAATSEISGGETLGYTAPPMMVHGKHRNMGEVEQERAHARWRSCSGHQ